MWIPFRITYNRLIVVVFCIYLTIVSHRLYRIVVIAVVLVVAAVFFFFLIFLGALKDTQHLKKTIAFAKQIKTCHQFFVSFFKLSAGFVLNWSFHLQFYISLTSPILNVLKLVRCFTSPKIVSYQFYQNVFCISFRFCSFYKRFLKKFNLSLLVNLSVQNDWIF